MKTNKIKITFKDGSVKWIQATESKIRKHKDVVKYVLNNYLDVAKIETRHTGKRDPNYKYFELHYSTLFEQWLKSKCRIESTNPKGHEDLTGYGAQTDGKKNRFYIGRSTGWLPIYLEVLKRNSNGGAALYITKGRTFKRV